MNDDAVYGTSLDKPSREVRSEFYWLRKLKITMKLFITKDFDGIGKAFYGKKPTFNEMMVMGFGRFRCRSGTTVVDMTLSQ